MGRTQNLVKIGLLIGLLLISTHIGNSIKNQTSNQQNGTPNQLFVITLLVPNTNPARNSWSLAIAQELPSIGIGVNLIQAPWSVVLPMTFSFYMTPSPVNGIPTASNGGFDVLFVGFGSNLQTDPQQFLSPSYYSPPGNNIGYYDNSTLNNLFLSYNQTLDPVARTPIGDQIQQLMYQEESIIPLLNEEPLIPYQNGLSWTVLDLMMMFTEPYYHSYFSKLPGISSNLDLIYETPYFPYNFLPNLAQSSIDLVYQNPLWSLMYERNPNDPNYAYQPVMAKYMPIYNDTTFTTALVTLKANVTFSNGDLVSAQDVVNTYHMAMTAAAKFINYAIYWQYFDTANYGLNAVAAVNSTTICFRLAHPYYNAIKLFDEPVLDQKVVGNYLTPTAPNYNFNSVPTTYAIGTGPYIYDNATVSVATTTGNIKIVRNTYWWGSNLAYAGTWWGGGRSLLNSLTFLYVNTMSSAINDLNNGAAQILDPGYSFTPSELSGLIGSTYSVVPDLNTQEMMINMHHPILGTGASTPLGISNPSKAAEAARYVRQAIAYMIQQQNIINTNLNGIGETVPTIWPRDAIGFDNIIPVRSYNIATAMSLMEKAGYVYTYPNSGSTITVTTTVQNNVTYTVTTSNSNTNSSPLPIFNSPFMILIAFMTGYYIKKKRKIIT